MKLFRKAYLLPLIFTALIFISSDRVLLFNGIDDFDIDVAGNIFIRKGFTVEKYNTGLDKKVSFTDYSYGNITSFEAEDALNFFIYYSTAAKILFLDNSLNVKRSAIDLGELGFPQASLACPSYNTGFWLYDPVTVNLVRFNRLLQKSQSTGNLQQLTGESVMPTMLRETGDYVFLADTLSGVFVFDRYGAFLRKIPFKNVKDFQLVDVKLNMLCHDTLFSYDMKTLQVDTVKMPFDNITKFKYSSRLFYYSDNAGSLYRLKINE